MMKNIATLLFAWAVLGVPTVGRAAKCPSGKVFSPKLLKCVSVRIRTCPAKQYMEKGRCVKFVYGKLTVKPLFADQIKMTDFPINARRYVNKGLAYYRKQAYMAALFYFKHAYLIKNHELLGHMIGECYRRSGDQYYANAIYRQLEVLFPKGPHAALATRLRKRYEGMGQLLLKCRQLHTPSCRILTARYGEDIKEGYDSGQMGLAMVEMSIGKSKEAKARLLKTCKKGLLRACSGLGWVYFEKDRNEHLALRYLKIGCDGGGQWSCTLMGTFLEYSLLKPGLANSYYRRACAEFDPYGCYQVARIAREKKVPWSGAMAFLERQCLKRRNAEACIKGGEIAETRKNERKARKFYKAACDEKHTSSCIKLGQLLAKNEKTRYMATNSYREACEEGDPEGCKYLGRMYASQQNFSLAATTYNRYAVFYDKPCRAGDMESCRKLMDFYALTVKSPVKTRYWAAFYAKLADKSCTGGDRVSCMLAMGTYGSYLKNFRRARDIAARMCALKQPNACERAAYYSKQLGESGSLVSVTTYEKQLQEQCEAGNLYQCTVLGSNYVRKKMYPQGIKYLKYACEGGLFFTCMNLARVYQIQLKNRVEAAKWYAYGCTNRNSHSCQQLGIFNERDLNEPEAAIKAYMKGCALKLETSCTRAASLYKKQNEVKKARGAYLAAAKILEDQCRKNRYGFCTRAGDIYAKDLNNKNKSRYLYERGATEIRKQCKQNNARQCYAYGFILKDKLNNLKLAATYFQKGCDGGNVFSCYMAGRMYIETNRERRGRKLLEAACDKKNRPACNYLRRLERQGVSKPRKRPRKRPRPRRRRW